MEINGGKTQFDELKKEQVDGILWFTNVPRNHVLVVEDRLAKKGIKIKTKGIRLAQIFLQKKTTINMSYFSMQYSINEGEGALTEDKIDVHGLVTVECQINPSEQSIRKYYDQEFANEQVINRTRALIKELINKFVWDKLKETKMIQVFSTKSVDDLEEYTKEIKAEKDNANKKEARLQEELRKLNSYGVDLAEIGRSANEIIKDYGIRITKIDLTGIQAPKGIADIEENKRIADNENKIRLQKAATDLEVAKKEAEAEKARAAAQTEILKERAEQLGLTPEQLAEYIKAQALPSGSIAILGNSNMANLVAATEAMKAGSEEKGKTK